uniref:Uncharacterized protein n=1 Tax=Sphaerodactylus townsendi TaxID=933632 RepID=A0ACB8FYS4_9SAUR
MPKGKSIQASELKAALYEQSVAPDTSAKVKKSTKIPSVRHLSPISSEKIHSSAYGRASSFVARKGQNHSIFVRERRAPPLPDLPPPLATDSMAASPPRPTPPQRLDWAAEGFGRRQTVRAGEPSGGAALDAPAGSGPPAILSLHAASPGSEGEAATGDGRTGCARRRGSGSPQRLALPPEETCWRPLPRRSLAGLSALPTAGAGVTALPGFVPA